MQHHAIRSLHRQGCRDRLYSTAPYAIAYSKTRLQQMIQRLQSFKVMSKILLILALLIRQAIIIIVAIV